MGVGVSGHLYSRGNHLAIDGPAGVRQLAMPRNRAAFRNAVAKATRTRVAVSEQAKSAMPFGNAPLRIVQGSGAKSDALQWLVPGFFHAGQCW